jgi:ATP-dependent helicase/nuclease subunit A
LSPRTAPTGDCDEAHFYALACDPERSGVVEACAGAGKTWMLVSRIVRALLGGAAPDEILAITFTRKGQRDACAAPRVAAPVRRGQCRPATPRIAHKGIVPKRADRLEPALAQLHARVLHAGAEVQIHTFHAWFAQLLRLAPLETLDALGLQPAMSLIEEIDDQVGELLRRFQREVLNAPGLLADYQALTERHGRWRLDQWLRAALDKRLEIERADARDALQPAIESASQRWPACAGFAHPLQRIAGDAALRRLLGRAVDTLCGGAGKVERRAGDALPRRSSRRCAGRARWGTQGLVHEGRPAAQLAAALR